VDRRTFLGALGLLATPLGAEAQTAQKMWRIGWLGDGSRTARESNTLSPLRDGLRELGYMEGKNLVIDARWSEGTDQQLARDAGEFVRLNVDVIVTHGTPAGLVAKQATTTIPIVVATAADFVGAGLVASLSRPGGNITGTNDQAGEVLAKQIDLLGEAIPGLQRLAVLWYAANPSGARAARAMQTAARRRNIQVTPLSVVRPEDVHKAVETGRRERVRALVIVNDAWSLSNRARIVEAALASKLPAVGVSRLVAEAGALMTYGPDLPGVYKQAAVLVDKILRGTKPADIPIQQPTKFEFVINLKTAKALGLTIPPSLLARADQVIE
jgi:putative ABC transport system substrate-binding protein